MEWVLRRDSHLKPTQVCRLSHGEQVDTPWLLHCYNEDKYYVAVATTEVDADGLLTTTMTKIITTKY